MEQTKDTVKNTALLVMDVQAPMVSMLGEAGTQLLNNIAATIKAARDKHIPVVYVVVGFRKGYPEASPANKSFSAIRNSGRNLDSEEAIKVHTTVAPLETEIVVTKKRVSAFSGSDLEIVLRSAGIQHIVLSGIATSGVVLSTLREAADKDYMITVLADCCGDADAEVHRVLTEKVFRRQAEVMTHTEWIDHLT